MKIEINYQSFSKKKCKDFGYTFSIIFLLIFIILYSSSNIINYFCLINSILFFFISSFNPLLLKFFAFYWERFGIIIGRFFSPIILLIAYIITFIPINTIFFILRRDILGIKINKNIKSYWIHCKNKKINFKNQY